MSFSLVPMREQVTTYISALQSEIVQALELLDPTSPRFKRDSWERTEGGSGVSCTFSAPEHPESVLQKAGVNISMIYGMLPPAAIKQMATEHSSVPYTPDSKASLPFFAGGISIILHARNPNVPSVHANYRYFEITDKPTAKSVSTSATGEPASTPNTTVLAWWFGGITDLTPSYLFDDDAQHFHRKLREACDVHGPSLYPAFKKSCDDYFFIKHRNEHRGIGGIRFDDLCDEPHSLLPDDATPNGPRRPRTAEEIWAFVKSCAGAFLPSYTPILARRYKVPVDERMRRWQELRRGRYVEFNLVYDRGTKFGLATPGVRVENVLISMPEIARWEYMCELGEEEGTEEWRLVEVLKNPRDWA
ncbi:Oxygen-dependent coproporphyrinogen-III oxidase [Hypsizygus marmoreus]|uniref:coproporphyrinogen oxidase n=1 Tax=Hypsizygus marmoreus TaxID=39966 RepID=A0A369K0Z4_HYPMA|nr:Oxygen-dependent coproporphyrinogen-III oxidase [Hypsizygus marmoreus]